MPDVSVLDDPTASLCEQQIANAEIVPDKNGLYNRVVFLGDEKERVELFLAMSIAKTLIDYQGLLAKRDKNKAAYEGLSDQGENITLPWSRMMTNQQHAWLVDTLFSKDPFLTVSPLGDRKFEIIVKGENGSYGPKEVTSTDEAKGIQALLEYKWRRRLPMRKVLSDWLMEGLQDGSLPALVKTIYDDQKVRLTDRKKPYIATDTLTGKPKKNAKGQQMQIINSPEFRTVVKGESVRIVNVDGADFLKPISALDIDSSPWCAMKTDEQLPDTRRKIVSGKYDFCLPAGEKPTDEEINFVLFGSEPDEEHPTKRGKRAVREASKTRETDPTKTNVVYEVFFRWPVLTPESEKADTPTIEWQEMCGFYHERAKKLLSCWQLGDWSGERPFVDFFMRQRPNSYSGTCTVEDIAPFQRYASNLFHLQVQNMVMRNVSVFFVRKGSSTSTFLKGRKLKPGMVVEFDEPDDVRSVPLGTPIESISDEIGFLKAGAQEASLVTQYDTATAQLTRVTSGAFSQQQDLAKLQPEMVYENFCAAVGRLALKYVQALIQYEPEQKLPEFDGVTSAVIDNVLHLPRQMVTDADFAFTATATARDETKEAMFQRDLQLAGEIANANNFMLSMFANIAQPNTPPPFVIMGLKAIGRGERILKSLIGNTRHDAAEFEIPEEEIMGHIISLQKIQQAMQQQQPPQPGQPGQPAGGQGGELQNAGAGGAMGAGPGGPAGPPQVPAQLGDQGAGAPAPSPNLPA